MFFFFAGSVEQQVGRIIQTAAGRCIRCGSPADLVESEKVLKLFFVPVWRWPDKRLAFYCRNCDLVSPHSLPLVDAGAVPSLTEVMRCRSCARAVDPEYRFCPFCGSAL